MKTATIDTRTMAYHEAGQGPALLLVHGFPLDHSMWNEQIASLSNQYRVIAPDLRGFGKSDGAGEVTTMADFADDVAKLVDHLGIEEPIHFCGLSMGGYVAWQFFLRHRAKLASLMVCDSRAAADSPEAAEGRRKTAAKVLAEGSAVVADAMLPKLFGEWVRSAMPEVVEATDRVMRRTSPVAVAAALVGMAARIDFTPHLAKVDLPTLIVCGEHDVISPLAEMKTIADAIPGAKFCAVEGAGHMSPLEKPQIVSGAIREFLTSAMA